MEWQRNRLNHNQSAPNLTDGMRTTYIARLEERIEQLKQYPVAGVAEGWPSDLQVLGKEIERLLEKAFGLGTPDFDRFRSATQLTYDGPLVMGRSLTPSEIRKDIGSNIESAIATLAAAQNALREDMLDAGGSAPKQSPAPSSVSTTDVFVVHGHDHETLEKVARTIERLGLHPIILHEQPNQGRTLIEKFEQNSDVGFAVVILTADDVGGTDQDKLKPRARQNVVLELGYFIGRLRRLKVCALKEEGVEMPSDLFGLGYTALDPSGVWRFELARELKAAGYKVDVNNLI